MAGARHRFVRLAASILFASTVSGPALAAGQDTGLRATAGLDGIARAGRWVPVTITIPAEAAGTIEAALGDGTVVRDIDSTAAAGMGRRTIELYLRAPDADEAIVRVRMLPLGTTAEAAVRILPSDAVVTLCVAAAGVLPADSTCTATLDASAMPRSWRGLDAVDAMAWAPAARASLDPAARQAVDRALAVRAWNDSVSMAPLMPPLPATARPAASPALPIVAILLVMLVLAGPRLARRPAALYATVGLLIILGSAAAYAHGRLGASARTQVRESLVIRAGGAHDVAQIYARGEATFPAAAPFAVSAAVDDVELLVKGIRNATISGDAGGAAVARGVAAKRDTLHYDVTGFLPQSPVTVSHAGSTRLVRNRLPTPLRNCVVIGASGTGAPADIAPGASLSVELPPDASDPAISCDVENAPAALDWASHGAVTDTRATVVIDLREDRR